MNRFQKYITLISMEVLVLVCYLQLFNTSDSLHESDVSTSRIAQISIADECT